MTRIAVLQMTSGIDPGANAETMVSAIGAAAQGGAAMLFTPEMSGLLDRERARATPHILPEDANPVLAAVRAAAAQAGIWVAIGSLAIARDHGRWANRSFVINASGDVVARYDNSENNPRNPNRPPRAVTWGEETTDEMCIAFVGYTADAERLTRGIPAPGALPDFGTGNSGRLRQEILRRFDTNGDGQLDAEERKAAAAALTSGRFRGGGDGAR